MNKFLNRTVWLVIIIPIVYLALAWNSLPEKIATHFDLHGNADKFDTKNEFLWFMMIMVVVAIAVYLLISNIWRIDPKKYAAENKGRLQKIAFALVVFLAAIQCFVIYIGTQGSIKLNFRIFFVLIGIFWAVIANYMNNLKPNYFAGFRLPWTLENEENWRRTHHLASKLWFAGGLLLAAISIFTSNTVCIIAIFSILVVITIIPIVYSYRLYKKQKSLKPID
jgi:uncharacterized membrane protein